jgi:hypothetical protein
LQHRNFHKKWLYPIEPKPHSKFIASLAADAEPELVRSTSPKWAHREMYARALQFKREFHYDFAQWGDPEKDFKAHGFLFNDDTGVFGHGAIVGACAFRWREPCARLGDAVGMDRAQGAPPWRLEPPLARVPPQVRRLPT